MRSIVAVGCAVACASGWVVAAAPEASGAVRREAVRTARPQLEVPLGSLAFSNSATSRAGRAARVVLARPKARFSITPGKLSYRGGPVKFASSASGATRCTLSSKPRLFSGPNPHRVNCRGAQTLAFPAVAVGLHWTFKFTARNARGQVSRATRKLVLEKPPFAVSGNWAGYAIGSNMPVTEISGQFTVPTLNCKDTNNASEAMWVGIGGDGPSSGDLLQTGVVSTCSGGRQVENPAWWEEYPESLITKFQSMSVSPGNQIAASVYQASDGSWFTRLDDLTTGISGLMHSGDAWGTVSDSAPTTWLQREGDASTVSYNGGSSAEWIIEDYGLANGAQVPFADFGTVAFSNLATSIPSWSLTPGEEIGIGNQNGLLLAAPSAPSGNGFSVAYTG